MRTTASILPRTFLMLAISLPSIAGAQSVAIYGGAEAAGYGEGSAVLGTSISAGGLGLQPYVSFTGVSYRARIGRDTYSVQSAFAPSVGLRYGAPTHSVQAGIGYVFTTAKSPARTTAGGPLGTRNSVNLSAQYTYWGDGSKDVNVLGSYTLKSRYLWTRANALTQLGAGSQTFAGGEFGVQGSMEAPSFYRIQFGPAIQYRVSNAFRIGGAAGARISTGDSAPPMTGYARVEFLILPGR